ncbi:MAG: hypothetical protein K8S94_13290 [Planctomycetia bacterium]|nr:hypothetical protein [Planctomycetia bacterium]
MHRDGIRRCLAWGLAATLLLPITLAVVLGLGGLLDGLGDALGAAVCGRLGLVLGSIWLAAIVATTVVNAVAVLDGRGGPRGRHEDRPRRARRRRRRIRRDERVVPGLGETLSERPS